MAKVTKPYGISSTITSDEKDVMDKLEISEEAQYEAHRLQSHVQQRRLPCR